MSRLEGVSEITYRGGTKKELRVSVDMKKLAYFGISINELINILKSSSSQITAGELVEGKRTYTLRSESISYTSESAKKIVVKSEKTINGSLVFVKLGDVADVYVSHKKPTSFRRINGQYAITFAVLREPNSNVVKTMKGLSKEINLINKSFLNPLDLNLSLIHI